MTFLIPSGFAPNGNGGPRVDVGGNGGISGCVDLFGIEFCGSLGGAGGGSGPVPSSDDPGGGGLIPFQDVRCPSGSRWSAILNRCVDFGAFPPGGDPLFPDPISNGCPDGGVPKVQTTHQVTPILWKSQYGCKPAPGYRLNKSAYFRVDPSSGAVVRVGKEMAWVKGRRRNAANLRATDRAISRVKSAKEHAQSLGRVTVKSKADYKHQRESARRSRKK